MKLPPKRVIYNNQIELRLMSPRDGHAIYQGVVASLSELRRFMNWAHYDTDLTKACIVYAQFEAKSLRGEEVNFSGFDFNTGDFLFCCSLTPGSRLNPLDFEIGYWVASNHTRKGLATIAAKTLISLAFHKYQANRVSVTCNPENTASLKVIENCGFQYEGRLRNYHIHPTPSMLANGYSPIADLLSFSLVPDDLPSLTWFKEFHSHLSIIEFDQK